MGYKHTIYDDPKMIQLLARAGIYIDGVDYDNDTTTFVEDTKSSDYSAETKTLRL